MEVITVIARDIDIYQFSYICPTCSIYNKKNGELLIKPKLKIHYHGSCGNLRNRTESRSPHCDIEILKQKNIINHHINIIINDTTIRKY